MDIRFKNGDRVKLSFFSEGYWRKVHEGLYGTVTEDSCSDLPVVLFDNGEKGFGSENFLIPAEIDADVIRYGKYYKLNYVGDVENV